MREHGRLESFAAIRIFTADKGFATATPITARVVAGYAFLWSWPVGVVLVVDHLLAFAASITVLRH